MTAMNTISLATALQKKILTDYDKPVISYYSFTKIICDLYKDRAYKGVPIGKISSDYPSKKVTDRNIRALVTSGSLSDISILPVYEIPGHIVPSAQQIICELNPFCYLSYLSAMEWHSITDRIPKVVHVTTCTNKQFSIKARDLAKIDFPGFDNDTYPLILKRHKISAGIKGKKIKEHTSSGYMDKPPLSQTGGIRVSSIGDTFLDMLQKPEFCGGVDHVLSVFEEYAPKYLPVIVRAINKKGRPIDKVRCGYVLEERLKLSHADFDKWKKHAQRGGSRKFVSSSPYENKYSESWCISLNFTDG